MLIVLAALLLHRGILPRGLGRAQRDRSCPVAVGTLLKGCCVGVTDGDTIDVLWEGRPLRVRLWGVDAPEKQQAFGMAAKGWTSSQTFGRTLLVDVRDVDRYGRAVGWVSLPDGRVLNEEIVRSGYAWWYRHFAEHEKKLAQLESQARSARRGLWSAPSPEPPWQFRRSHRAGNSPAYRRW